MVATGVGSMPGEDARAHDEAIRVVVGELGSGEGIPYLPELPARGPQATLTGRGVAVIAGLAADLQPAGWRLTDAPGVDQRRARSLLAQDLDGLEEALQGYRGAAKVQVAGPWTLAATVERPRGDKVLADHGARRDLAQALAEGVGEHVTAVRRRLGGVDRLVVQLDEPLLDAVLEARVPTASGFGRHRAVDAPEAVAALEWVVTAVSAAGAEPWVHSCAADPRAALLLKAGAQGLSVDPSAMPASALDALAAALDTEPALAIALGVVPGIDPDPAPGDVEITETALRWLDRLGLDPAVAPSRVVLTPRCGLAGASAGWARAAHTVLVRASEHLVSG